jgi:DNA topoisomerase VI subunit B
MTGHDGQLHSGKFTVYQVNIAMAYGRGSNADFNFTLLRWINIYVLHYQRFAKFVTYGSFHNNSSGN